MKIAIASDLHLGFGKGTEREQEAFEQAKVAFGLALSEKADLLLLAGDIFDSDVPPQETWLGAFRLFSIMRGEKTKEKFSVKKLKGEAEEDFECTGCIPVIAIAGTHEFRSRDFKNALEVLQEAGCLVYLHAAKAEFELGGERVVVHGLSGVPEKKALDALRLWSPQPERGAVNVLLLHQSIKEFLPFDDEMIASISLGDLPKGFDLIVDGHLHWFSDKNLKEKNFLVCGSTVITQMKRLEAEKEKGISIFDTVDKKIRFVPLPGQRKFFYTAIEFKSADAEKVLAEAEEKLQGLLEKCGSGEKPLVKLKLKGTLAKGLAVSDIDLGSLKGKFAGRAVLSIDRSFEETAFKEKLAELRALQLEKKSVSTMGFELLQKNLAETKFGDAFDVRRVFDLLAEGENEKVAALLSGDGEADAVFSGAKEENRPKRTGKLQDYS
ncbi:MAG: DNA repair exonuclease [Candidatus Diapherotrites archaeon]|nr:DNA repair exonuclease [Candidatus Diapherotrites archaeon]